MGVLQFDGTDDRIRWTTLASALQNTSDGACTMGFLIKRDSLQAGTHGLGYLLSGATTAEFGLGFWDSSGGAPHHAFMDISEVGTRDFPSNLGNTTDSMLLVVSKAAGTSTPRLGWKLEPGGAWTHEDANTTLVDQAAASILEIGCWEGGEFLATHIGLVGVWEGAMSDGDKEALDDNWQTSDWWQSAHGEPVFLAELNVAGASVVDLAENASSLAVTGTTLDAAETLDDWTFNGTGIAPPSVAVDADYSRFPKHKLRTVA